MEQATPKRAPGPFPLDIEAMKRESAAFFEKDKLSKSTRFKGRTSLPIAKAKYSTAVGRRLSHSPLPRPVQESYEGQLGTPVESVYAFRNHSDSFTQQTINEVGSVSPEHGSAKPIRTAKNGPHPHPYLAVSASVKGKENHISPPRAPALLPTASASQQHLMLSPAFKRIMSTTPAENDEELFQSGTPQHYLVLFQIQELNTEIEHAQAIIRSQKVTVEAHKGLLSAQEAILEAHFTKRDSLLNLLEANVSQFTKAPASPTSSD
ncbi:hypothetical protein NMY22_g9114 [Coprinellus aureogranulatus]|nr:hypothetical protein NMY22_g9114 [Coprinellus aureogranulatus]